MRTPAIGGDHAQQAGRCPDLIVAQHERWEGARVGAQDRSGDPGLLAGPGRQRDRGVLDPEQVMQADQGARARLPVATGKHGDRLALRNAG